MAAKRAAPAASLGTLILGAQFADLIWPVFLLLGWERVRAAPGITRITPLDFVSYPYSHSLAADVVWGAAVGAVYFAFRRDLRASLTLALCVPSHWVLDFISHRPDMPVVPGGALYGLGLWYSLPATLSVELALFGIGIMLYVKQTHARDRIGFWAYWSLCAALLLIYLGSLVPSEGALPSQSEIAVTALALWITIPWGAWSDRHRSLRRTA